MNMLWLKLNAVLMDELTEAGGAGAGGGGDTSVSIDIDAASDAIGADLGLNEGNGTDELLNGPATPSEEKSDSSPKPGDPKSAPPKAAADPVKERIERAGKLAAARQKLTSEGVDLQGKTDDEILKLGEPAPAVEGAPKSWKKEMHEAFKSLPPEVQTYIAQRENEVAQGIQQYAEKARFADEFQQLLEPYEPLMRAQNADAKRSVQALLNAHYILSTENSDRAAEFFARLARNYNVDVAKMFSAYTNSQPGEQPANAPRDPRVDELQKRLDAQDAQRAKEQQERFQALKAQTDAEVAAFAADPAHPYFGEVSQQVVLLLQDPDLSLEKAYEMAVYANPVTRAKEMERLRVEAEQKAREEAEKAAEAAEKARGVRLQGREEHRDSPDILGSMEDTMRETFRKINQRQ